MATDFKDRLKNLMEQCNMSAAELSRQSKVSKQTISNWLSGRHPRDIAKLKRVSDALKTSIDYLIFGTELLQKPVNLQTILDEGQPIRGTFDVEIRLVKKSDW